MAEIEKTKEKAPWADQALPKPGQLVRIKAHRDGYRRGGKEHTKAHVDHKHDAFTQEQLWQLHHDQNISVMYVDPPKAEAKKPEKE